MSTNLQRRAESEAGALERRARRTADPVRAAELRERAAAVRKRGQSGRTAPADMLDTPTMRIPVARRSPDPPPAPARRASVRRGDAIRVGLVAGALAALVVAVGMNLVDGGSGASDPTGVTEGQAPATRYTADDRQACRDGDAALLASGRLADADLDTDADRKAAQADMLAQAGRIQDAANAADSSRLSRALDDGADLLRRTGALLDDPSGADAVARDTGPVFAGIGAACDPVLGER